MFFLVVYWPGCVPAFQDDVSRETWTLGCLASTEDNRFKLIPRLPFQCENDFEVNAPSRL